jgi:membrane protease YdiL (CAAX protease family)
MNRQRREAPSETKSPFVFIVLVFLLSIPIWTLGPVIEGLLPNELPVNLPISSLMTFAPMTAAAILVWRNRGTDGVRKLLKRAFDHKRITEKSWYAPTLLFWPALMVLQYVLMTLMGVPLAAPQIPVLMVVVSFAVFFVAAVGEELGWQGYAIDPLQRRWNALPASVILGIVWGGWHVVPMIQLGQTPAWIAWQCMSLVVARILMVWLYQNTGQSVYATILFHAMDNVTTVLLVEYGWPYSPVIATIALALAAAAITFLWGPATLARFRYSRSGTCVRSAGEPLPVSEARPWLAEETAGQPGSAIQEQSQT